MNEIKAFACSQLSKAHSKNVQPEDVVIVAIKTMHPDHSQTIVQILYSPGGNGVARVSHNEWRPRLLQEIKKEYGEWYMGYEGEVIDYRLSRADRRMIVDDDFTVKDQELLLLNHICRKTTGKIKKFINSPNIWKLISYDPIDERCGWCFKPLNKIIARLGCIECDSVEYCSEECSNNGKYSHSFICTQLKAKKLQHRAANKVGRNARCPCGSGMKYKKCCLVR